MFDEQRYFAAGNRVRAFDTRFGRIGLLDLRGRLAPLSRHRLAGADEIDFLIIVANSPGRGVRGDELGSQQTLEPGHSHVREFLNIPVVFANRVGYEDGVCFWGGSEVVGPSGADLDRGAALEPALIIADIDPRETRCSAS